MALSDDVAALRRSVDGMRLVQQEISGELDAIKEQMALVGRIGNSTDQLINEVRAALGSTPGGGSSIIPHMRATMDRHGDAMALLIQLRDRLTTAYSNIGAAVTGTEALLRALESGR